MSNSSWVIFTPLFQYGWPPWCWPTLPICCAGLAGRVGQSDGHAAEPAYSNGCLLASMFGWIGRRRSWWFANLIFSGQGVPGCRGGLRPFCCVLVLVWFLRDFRRNGPIFRFTFSPAQWASPQLNGPVQRSSDRDSWLTGPYWPIGSRRKKIAAADPVVSWTCSRSRRPRWSATRAWYGF